MKIQNTFARYEYKYLLTGEQVAALRQKMEAFMCPDAFGRSTICNLYFDTPNFLLIRRSIENNVYKEKIRLRTYGVANAQTPAFIELKKKYQHVVYKRRICASYGEALQYLCRQENTVAGSQISAELNYALALYKELQPALYLSYEREAFYGREDRELRITFDRNILWRTANLDLSVLPYGREQLVKDQVLMEVKIGHAMPLWLSHFLNENNIYKTSYSKYGTAYRTLLKEGEIRYDH